MKFKCQPLASIKYMYIFICTIILIKNLKDMIDADFKDYLNRNAVPPYVHHFVRQNKHHIDELHLPRI
jgi:hypothetical protein